MNGLFQIREFRVHSLLIDNDNYELNMCRLSNVYNTTISMVWHIITKNYHIYVQGVLEIVFRHCRRSVVIFVKVTEFKCTKV